jgi:hypothetical protein
MPASLLFTKKNMKRLQLMRLVALLAIGSLAGCSKASLRPPAAADVLRQSVDRSGRGLRDNQGETGSNDMRRKPSPCIKWAKGSGQASKRLQKVVKKTADPGAISQHREKKLQAESEYHQ